MKQHLPFGFMSALLALGCLPSQAQVFIKPTGYKAIPLRVQSLNADVEIIGAFAITKWQMKIQLEGVGTSSMFPNQSAVGDFICARPTDAKVTSFRAGDCNGRVVEKSLVKPRLAFKAAKNDPLLKSGLNESNSFRASVYPLSTWNELTVSGTWVQTLSSVQGRTTYRLPLLSLKGATTRLNELNVKVNVRDAHLENLSTNYNLPIKADGEARVLTLGQKNYRLLRDLTLTVATTPTPLQPSLIVTRNAKNGGGHFALALNSNSNLQNAKLSWSGSQPLQLKPVKAGQVTLATGTYQGEAKDLLIRLTSSNISGDIKIKPTENEVADALWATQKINALSANAKANRAQIVTLSKGYSVASPLTTWLAVGDEDLKIYQRALVSGQLDPLVREYWMRIANGQAKSARTTQLKAAITKISQANKLIVEDELYMRLGSAYGYVLSEKYGNWGDWDNRTGKAKKANIEKRIARLSAMMLNYVSKKTGQQAGRSVDWASPMYGGNLYELRTKIMAEYRKPHPDYQHLKAWEHEFAAFYGSTYMDPRMSLWRAHVNAQNLETQTSVAEKSGDTAQLAQLEIARRDNSYNAYFVNNIGDPPIYVSAPADARQVVAVMPDGAIKTLQYNQTQKRWEGNYDVPVTTQEGDYSIQILIVNANYSRKRYAMKFRVDTTPPTGSGQALVISGEADQTKKPLQLQIQHGGDVARATALLPWGEKVALLPSTVSHDTFFATVRSPHEYAGKAIHVTYILIDRAHNLTTIEAEAVSEKAP